MKKLLGTFLFYLLWPLVWVYAPFKIRVRVVIENKQEFLVVENWFGPTSSQLPGGGQKHNESIKNTAQREIKEELGVVLDQELMVVLTDKPILYKSHGIFYRYLYVYVELVERPKLSLSRELSYSEWIILDSIDLPSKVRQEVMSQ